MGDESVAIWRELASNPEELNGTKSAYYLAQYHFDHQQAKEALSEVNALIDANPPHNYWLAPRIHSSERYTPLAGE